MQFIHLRAENDSNGNPRRAYVALEENIVRGVWDEEYSGHHCVPEAQRAAAQHCPSFAVTPSEYRKWVKFGANLSYDVKLSP